eukprot:5187705-Pyramimonas_sp.AAC.1
MLGCFDLRSSARARRACSTKRRASDRKRCSDLTDRKASALLQQEASVGSETMLGSDGPPGAYASSTLVTLDSTDVEL